MKKILLFFCFLSFFKVAAQKLPADLLVYNAHIYTVNDQFDTAEALVVTNGKFVDVGTTADLLQKYSPKQKTDAHQKPVFPGFYDPHSHFLGLGQMLSQCDLTGTDSLEEIIERLKKFDAQHPNNPWLFGRGWDQNDWTNKQFPSKTLLDKAFPNKPVALTRVDGHALVINSKALKLANITAQSKVEGGLVEVKNGEPTGILVDNAMDLAKRVIPKPTKAQLASMLLAAQKECFKVGLTTISDAGINRNEIELIDELQKAKTLKIRDYAMVSLSPQNIDHYIKNGIYKTDRLNVRAFKLYADGALGSRGACLLKPYADAPTSGFLLTSVKDLEKSLEQIAHSDFQANTHCIGDSANRLILDLYGKMLQTKNDRRWRIEHAQVVSKEDLPKFKQFSIIPSVQSTHATSDMYWAGDRLGAERVKTAYALKDLLAQNGVLANGSDFPVEFVNPLFGFHSAVARQDAKNFPEGGFQMENALSREEALRAMTIWAAFTNFEEKERGSIEVGKMADFVILEEDIMKINKEKLRNVKVLGTFIAGEKVY